MIEVQFLLTEIDQRKPESLNAVAAVLYQLLTRYFQDSTIKGFPMPWIRSKAAISCLSISVVSISH
jgi:hypothetical protein